MDHSVVAVHTLGRHIPSGDTLWGDTVTSSRLQPDWVLVSHYTKTAQPTIHTDMRRAGIFTDYMQHQRAFERAWRTRWRETFYANRATFCLYTHSIYQARTSKTRELPLRPRLLQNLPRNVLLLTKTGELFAACRGVNASAGRAYVLLPLSILHLRAAPATLNLPGDPNLPHLPPPASAREHQHASASGEHL